MKHIVKLGTIIAMSLIFSSCSYGGVNQNTKETDTNNAQSIQVQANVKIPDTEEIVNKLCSDEFQARFIGTKGNEKAGEYISKIFKDIGLVSLSGENYYDTYTEEVYKKYGLNESNDKPENKEINNVVGVIKGKDSKKAVVISAHFDHLGYVDGKIIRGAIDNASGVSALIEIAHTLKEKSKVKPFDMDIVLCAFNSEEEALSGSRAFVAKIKSKSLYENLYNINIDSIGAKKGGNNLALKDKSKISSKLYNAIKVTLRKDNIGFDDTAVKGVGDQMSFEGANIPNVFFVQEGIESLVHKPTDTPDTLDYGQIDKIANSISDFVETNDGVTFN